jgi:hypothetical protein
VGCCRIIIHSLSTDVPFWPPNQLSWITWQADTYFSTSDRLPVPHNYWISSEGQITIRLNVRKHLLLRNFTWSYDQTATPGLQIHCSLYWAKQEDNLISNWLIIVFDILFFLTIVKVYFCIVS